jgi:acetolactate synthase small subunit
MLIGGNITVWYVGFALGFAVTAIAVVIVMTIMFWASRIARQAHFAREAVETIREQSTELNDVPKILDSGVRILHSARSLRKVAVGK